MTTKVVALVVKELDDNLGYRTFYTIRDLTNMGYYGSMSAARKALAEGRLPFIKISSRRYVIPRSALFAYLEKNMIESKL